MPKKLNQLRKGKEFVDYAEKKGATEKDYEIMHHRTPEFSNTGHKSHFRRIDPFFKSSKNHYFVNVSASSSPISINLFF